MTVKVKEEIKNVVKRKAGIRQTNKKITVNREFKWPGDMKNVKEVWFIYGPVVQIKKREVM